MEKIIYQYIFFLCVILIIPASFFSCGTRIKDPLKNINSADSVKVYNINPVDGTASVPVNSVISITFNKTMSPATITSNALDTACTGNIQVSSDEFSTCIRMSGVPFSENGNLTFSVVPGSNLATNTVYKIRVTSLVMDINGNVMGADYTTPAGFTTNSAADLTPPVIFITDPYDNSGSINVNIAISVTFNETMNPLTMTTNTAGTTCSGSFQVSSDNFTSCTRMSGAPYTKNGNLTFSVVPGSNLATGTTYKIRIKAGVKDVNANSTTADYTTPAGFTTNSTADVTPPVIFITDPSDNTGSINVNTTVSVTFNEAMNPASITTNTADTACSGSFQVSSDNFASCIRMSGAPYAKNGDLTFSVVPGSNLATGTTYKIKIKNWVKDTAGNSMTADYTTPAGFMTNSVADVTPPAILLTEPYNNSGSIDVNSAVSVTFNESMNPATITTNTIDTVCTGSFQVSSNNFASCVRMSGDPYAKNGNLTFSVVPGSNLAVGTVYKIRIKNGVKDINGNSMTADYTMPAGFTTNAMTDVTPPMIFITDPYDNSGSINVNTSLSVTFNEAMNPTTITTNTGLDTSCSGSFQVSADNFATCMPMNGQPFSDNGDFTYQMTPASNLATSTNYKIRITGSAKDIAGNSISAVYTTPTGFTTASSADLVPPGIFFTDPADGATGILVNTGIAVTFTEAVDPLTMTANSADTTCTGTFQVSKDNFATCVRMLGAPFSVTGNISFAIVPGANLILNSNYKIKLTTGIKDIAGNPLAADYTGSFATALSSDTTPSQISLISPADNTTGVPVNTVIYVKFNEAINVGTVTTNTADIVCSGSLQVSTVADNFSACVQMSAAPVASQGNKKFTLTPASNLTNGVNYKIRIMSSVSDVAGNIFGADYTTPNGFVTVP